MNASVVKGSAILNVSVLVNDTYTNITLVSIANTSAMNLSNRGAGPLNPERWWGRNSTNELCGLTGVNVETTCTLVITAKDNASNTNSTTQFVVCVDNLAPRVLNFSTNLTISHKVIGSGHQINFSVNISDMNIFQ
ncbi:hypothetical protein HYU12_03780 [Candidatus Woesearchaeota archaeon]|nr:hypothetical protein [Candidatus Woesearchaeota archaeon]